MFNIAVITDQISMDFEKSLKAIKQMGLNFVEIHALWDKNVEDLSIEEIKEVKRLLKKYGLSVSNISSTIFLCCSLKDSCQDEFDELPDWFLTLKGNSKDHLDAVSRCINLCHELGTDKIRLFGFLYKREIEKNQLLPLLEEKYLSALQLVEKDDITLILENCPFSYLPTGIKVKEIINRINSNKLRALWDPGNTIRSKLAKDFPDDYEAIKDKIAHVHVKDVNFVAKKSADLEQVEEEIVPMGEGLVNYNEILPSLKQSEYRGCISLEPEFTLDMKNVEERIEAVEAFYKKICESV